MDPEEVKPNEQVRLDSLTVFSFLWATQAFVHQETFRRWLEKGEVLGILLTLVVTILLFRPQSVVCLGVMLIVNLCYSFSHLPYQVNHILFEDIVNLTLLTALLGAACRYNRTADRSDSAWRMKFLATPESREGFYDRFAPVVRLELVVLYIFATLHKINADFFNPAVSCGSHMLWETTATFPLLSFLNHIPGIATLTIWGILLAEGGLALLLFLPSTRKIGVVLGLFFHLILGLHPHPGVFSFSGMVYALYFLFLPKAFTATLTEEVNQIIRTLRYRRYFRHYLVGGGMVYAGCGTALIALNCHLNPIFDKSIGIWILGAIPLITIYLAILWRMGSSSSKPDPKPTPRGGFLWLFPALVFFNGLNPYLGLKTEYSFGMFSNLRTEGGTTNHLFISSSFQRFDFQKEVVEITDSDHSLFRWYQRNNLHLTRFEFERHLNEIPGDFSVGYILNGVAGQARKSNGAIFGIDARTRYSWWLGRVFLFRPVDGNDTTRCLH